MYTKKTTDELLDLLNKHGMLTFESQLHLSQELEERGVEVSKEALEASISKRLSEIENLEHLKDFGFTAEFYDHGVVVKRSGKAIFNDVVAVVVGLLVFLLGVYGIGSLAAIFINGEEIDVFSLAVNFALASLVFTGIRFFGGFKRLLDYVGFRLSNFKGTVTLKKRFDMKLEEVKESASKLFLETHDEKMTLKLDDYTIFSSNAENLTQRMTLETLVKILNNGGH